MKIVIEIQRLYEDGDKTHSFVRFGDGYEMWIPNHALASSEVRNEPVKAEPKADPPTPTQMIGGALIKDSPATQAAPKPKPRGKAGRNK